MTKYLGIDVGDRNCHLCLLGDDGKVAGRSTCSTEREALGAVLKELASLDEPVVAILEAGQHSHWIAELSQKAGLETIVANPRSVRLIYEGNRKSDRNDAEHLARLGRVDPQLLKPVALRSTEAQAQMTVLRSRDVLVRVRKALINSARGLAKTVGARLPACDADAFAVKVSTCVPHGLEVALTPLLATVDDLTKRIRALDGEIRRRAQERPEAKKLLEISGVGDITVLAFMLVVGDPRRFASARDIGPYLGLVPKRDQSGAKDPSLRISKAGNGFLRRLLVNCAQYIAGPRSPDSDLKRFANRIGPAGSVDRRKAIIAVTRKLAVLLLRLWQTGEPYQALRGAVGVQAI